jgi:hypothetical protein
MSYFSTCPHCGHMDELRTYRVSPKLVEMEVICEVCWCKSIGKRVQGDHNRPILNESLRSEIEELLKTELSSVPQLDPPDTVNTTHLLMVQKHLNIEDLVRLTTSATFVFTAGEAASVSPALRAEAVRQIVGRCLNADQRVSLCLGERAIQLKGTIINNSPELRREAICSFIRSGLDVDILAGIWRGTLTSFRVFGKEIPVVPAARVQVELRRRENPTIDDRCQSPPSSDSGCFVATAVYGDTMHPDVLTLRAFRDTRLRSSIVGRCCIVVYNSLGPRAARSLSHMPNLGRALRGLILHPVANLVRRWVLDDDDKN